MWMSRVRSVQAQKIWHFCHVTTRARLGENCNLGQNVFVAGGVVIGANIKTQNNVLCRSTPVWD